MTVFFQRRWQCGGNGGDTIQRLMDKLQISLSPKCRFYGRLWQGALSWSSFMNWWEHEVPGRERSSLNGAPLVQPRGRANRICWFLQCLKKCFERSAAQILQEKNLWTNFARSKTLNILYSKYLMTIHKLHNGFHRTIKVSFVLFAFSCAMCSPVTSNHGREVCILYRLGGPI